MTIDAFKDSVRNYIFQNQSDDILKNLIIEQLKIDANVKQGWFESFLSIGLRDMVDRETVREKVDPILDELERAYSRDIFIISYIADLVRIMSDVVSKEFAWRDDVAAPVQEISEPVSAQLFDDRRISMASLGHALPFTIRPAWIDDMVSFLKGNGDKMTLTKALKWYSSRTVSLTPVAYRDTLLTVFENHSSILNHRIQNLLPQAPINALVSLNFLVSPDSRGAQEEVSQSQLPIARPIG